MEHTLSPLSPLPSSLSPLPSLLFPLTSSLSPLTSLLANRKIVAAVTWPVGNVNPLKIMLVDGLINRQVKSTQ